MTDEAGEQVWSAEFTPFGKVASHEGEMEHVTQFTGKDLDEDTGLYYFNARWYDQETGRFISEDSVNDPNNPNLYVYGANNPLRYNDPTGHWNEDSVWWNPATWGNTTKKETVLDTTLPETKKRIIYTIEEKYDMFGNLYDLKEKLEILDINTAKDLLDEINKVIEQIDTQAGYPDARGRTNTTWCNRAAERILREMGYDTTVLYSRYDAKTDKVYSHYSEIGTLNFGYTDANRMAQNAAEAAERGDIREVMPEEAQELANQGIPVLAAQDKSTNPNKEHRIGHVGIVAPSDKPYDPLKGPSIGQAGNTNRIGSASTSFFDTTNCKVHYYVLNKAKE